MRYGSVEAIANRRTFDEQLELEWRPTGRCIGPRWRAGAIVSARDRTRAADADGRCMKARLSGEVRR